MLGVFGRAKPASSTSWISVIPFKLVPAMVTSSPVVASRLNVKGEVKPATNSAVGWAFTLKVMVLLVLPAALYTLNLRRLAVPLPSACVVKKTSAEI